MKLKADFSYPFVAHLMLQTAEGTELVAVQIDASFNASATPFLQTVEDPVVRGWIVEVMGYWSELIRFVRELFHCHRAQIDSREEKET